MNGDLVKQPIVLVNDKDNPDNYSEQTETMIKSYLDYSIIQPDIGVNSMNSMQSMQKYIENKLQTDYPDPLKPHIFRSNHYEYKLNNCSFGQINQTDAVIDQIQQCSVGTILDTYINHKGVFLKHCKILQQFYQNIYIDQFDDSKCYIPGDIIRNIQRTIQQQLERFNKMSGYLSDTQALLKLQQSPMELKQEIQNLKNTKTPSWSQIKAECMKSTLKLTSENQQTSIFPFSKDKAVYTKKWNDIFLNWNQLEMLMHILEEHSLKEITGIEDGKKHKQEANLYVISSPTGTGKTIAYILANLLWFQLFIPIDQESQTSIDTRKQYFTRLNTIVFVNTSQVAQQVFKEYKAYTNLRVTIADLAIESDGKFKLSIRGPDDVSFLEIDENTEIISHNSQQQVLCGTKPYFCKYLIFRDKLTNEEKFIDMAYFRNSGILGQIFIAPLHIVQFLKKFGVIDAMTKVNTVIYDEIDVYYQFQNLEQFHRYFCNTFINVHATNIIFASATIKPELIQINDYNLSDSAIIRQQLIIEQEVKNRTPFKIITQSAVYTVSNVTDAEILLNNLWNDDKIYCYYNLHKDLFDYCTLTNNSMKVVNEFTYEFRNQISNIDMFIWLLKKYGILYVTNRKLRYLPFYKYNKYNTFRNIYTINKFATYIPSIVVIPPSELALSYNDLINLLGTKQINSDVQNTPTLIITTDDVLLQQYILDKLEIPNLFSSNITDDEQRYQNIESLIDSDIIKSKMPFLQQLERNTTDKLFPQIQLFAEGGNMKYGNFNLIGRGIDIPELQEILLLVPVVPDLERDSNITFSELKQLLGRVGRNGRLGNVQVIFYGQPANTIDNTLPEDDIFSNDQQRDDFKNKLIKQYQNITRTKLTDDNFRTQLQKLKENIKKNQSKMKQWLDESGFDVKKNQTKSSIYEQIEELLSHY